MKKITQRSIGCRGVGNLGAKVLYFLFRSGLNNLFKVRFIVIKNDLITIKNLGYFVFHGLLPLDTILIVDGTRDDVREIVNSFGGKACQYTIIVLADKQILECNVFIDFTHDVSTFHFEKLTKGIPIIIQAYNYHLGSFKLPPLERNDVVTNSSKLIRAPECSLSGAAAILNGFKGLANHCSLLFTVYKGGERHGSKSFHFSDSYGRKRNRELQSLMSSPCLISYIYNESAGPFYLAHCVMHLQENVVLHNFGSWKKFDREHEIVFSHDQRVKVAYEDNTSSYQLPSEPEYIDLFAGQYGYHELKQPIIYFKRSYYRRGTVISFDFGFDINITPVLSNLDLILLCGLENNKDTLDTYSRINSLLIKPAKE